MKPEEVYILDENSKWIGIEPKVLMENAGKGVAKTVLDKLNKERIEEIGIFCGKGNNGGDGFVAARHLSSYTNVNLYLFGEETSMSNIARDNFNILKEIPSVKINKIRDSTNLDDIDFNFDVILDALLGVGIHGEPREPMKTAVKKINQQKSKTNIISVDVPSGFGSNLEVNSDFSITFHAKKDSQEKPEVIDIGIPKDLEHLVGPGDIKSLNKRDNKSHKGQNGKLMIIGGSKNYHGAPLLSSETASKIVDLVYLATTSEVISKSDKDIIPIKLEGEYLTENNVNELIKKISKYNIDTVLIGPGIGEKTETLKAVTKITKKTSIPIVVDADALKAKSIINNLSEKDIITPHHQELKNLLNKNIKISNNVLEKGEQLKNIAKDLGVTTLLKGEKDYISNGKKWKFNKTGNSGMTTGGTGDVLSGLVTALRTKNTAMRSASSATFINGYTGNKLYKENGSNFTASELINLVPKSYKEIQDF